MPLFMRLFAAILLVFPLALASAAEPDRAALFEHELGRLHSSEVVNLQERFQGHPLLIVNTASHCGYTDQFGGLERLHQDYRDQGLKVVGFPSHDFNQEADDEAETARVCFQNFGVTFDMFKPIGVRGDGAHPIFRELARQADAPRWNFYKYVVDRDGRVVAHFPSRVGPNSTDLRGAIESIL
ncbi:MULTISPECIES: glutathione peroxidase [unclassified Thioalkalivibrio]|uniref:glutathione peroxidase n=1 Tax=unclassified Thioalkalivibrio TaxID=2621013 RepID=UPI00035CDD53|nr:MULTISPECIES: glutathione peroxidase [unclassified Thioalkalivibrio]